MCFGTQNCCHGDSSQTTVISIKSISFYLLAYLSFVQIKKKKNRKKLFHPLFFFFFYSHFSSSFKRETCLLRTIKGDHRMVTMATACPVGWEFLRTFIILTEFVIIFQIFIFQQMQIYSVFFFFFNFIVFFSTCKKFSVCCFLVFNFLPRSALGRS